MDSEDQGGHRRAADPGRGRRACLARADVPDMRKICERRRVPRLALDGVAVGRQRLGVNLMSRIPFTLNSYIPPCARIQYDRAPVFIIPTAPPVPSGGLERPPRVGDAFPGARPRTASHPPSLRSAAPSLRVRCGRQRGDPHDRTGAAARPVRPRADQLVVHHVQAQPQIGPARRVAEIGGRSSTTGCTAAVLISCAQSPSV